MTYSNYTPRQINPRAYDIPYIGKQATLRFKMKLASERLFDLETKMNKLYQTTDQTDRVLRNFIRKWEVINSFASKSKLNILTIKLETREKNCKDKLKPGLSF